MTLSSVSLAVCDRTQFELHYKGRAVDVKLVGRELGVRYVLEGASAAPLPRDQLDEVGRFTMASIAASLDSYSVFNAATSRSIFSVPVRA